MGIVVRERAAHESALMDHKQGLSEMILCGKIQPEPLIRSGWGKCRDSKSGPLYFKDWNCATQTNRDPRQSDQIDIISLRGLTSFLTSSSNEGDSFSKLNRENISSMSKDKDHSLELTLNLPGTTLFKPTTAFNQAESMYTIEKVRSALDRTQWLNYTSEISRKRTFESRQELIVKNLIELLSLSPFSPSSSRDSTLTGQLQSDSSSKSSISSPSISRRSSSSESHFTSPFVIDSQDDDEEVHQPNASRESGDNNLQVYLLDRLNLCVEAGILKTMVAAGCRSCLMYVMLSNSHPCCPRCGNADATLLEVPGPQFKKQRTTTFDYISLRWS